LDARADRARVQALPRLHDAGSHELLVVLVHFDEQLLVGNDARLGVLVGLDQNHEPHRRLSFAFLSTDRARELASTVVTRDGRLDRQGARISRLWHSHRRSIRGSVFASTPPVPSGSGPSLPSVSLSSERLDGKRNGKPETGNGKQETGQLAW